MIKWLSHCIEVEVGFAMLCHGVFLLFDSWEPGGLRNEMKLLKTGEDSLEGLQTYYYELLLLRNCDGFQRTFATWLCQIVPDCAMLPLTCRMPLLSSQSTEINPTCRWGIRWNQWIWPGWIEAVCRWSTVCRHVLKRASFGHTIWLWWTRRTGDSISCFMFI